MSLDAMAVFFPAVVVVLAAGGLLGTVSYHRRQKVLWADDLARANRKARTDALTGLPNRHGLLEELATLVHGSGPWSLILLDVDGFKSVNDQFGHSVGDMVLATIAQRLKAGVCERSFVARLGGDEFVVLTPGPAHCVAPAVEQIARLVGQSQEYEGVVLHVGISAGVAVYEPGLDSLDLIRRADEAMYRAKKHRCGQRLSGPGMLYGASAALAVTDLPAPRRKMRERAGVAPSAMARPGAQG